MPSPETSISDPFALAAAELVKLGQIAVALLWSADDMAIVLGCSRAHVHQLHSRGLLPEGEALGDGKAIRWSAAEVRAWAAAGRPGRASWRLMKAQAMRKAG